MRSTRRVGPRRRPLSQSKRADVASEAQERPGSAPGGQRGADGTHASQFFARLRRTFAKAEERFPRRIVRQYDIGGNILRLRFAGPALVAQMVPALGHLASDLAAPADLTVLLWDSRSTCTIMPRPPWEPAACLARGEMRDYEYGPFRACLTTAPTTFCMLSREARLATFWIEDAERLPAYEHAAPLRVLLNWWLSGRQQQVMHAAAVGSEGGGVLLVGKRGSGKSTAASACLDSSLMYASDDYCLVTTASAPHVHSLYNSAHGVWKSPSTSPSPPTPPPEKPFVFLHERLPEKIARGFPLNALVLPRITEGVHTSVAPASPGATLKALAPTTMTQFPGTTEQSFRVMASLVKRLPSYYLYLGTDRAIVPALIADIIDQGAS